MAFRKLPSTNSQGAQSSSGSSGEKGKFRSSEREQRRGSNRVRFLATEDEKISKTQSEYYVSKATSSRWWNKSKGEKDISESEPTYTDYEKTHSKGMSRSYKREVVCPKCNLKVSSFSSDFVRCRRCGLEYTIPNSDRLFERDENVKNKSQESGEASSQSDSEMLKRKQFLMIQCLECLATRIVYVYPEKIGEPRCTCKGVMVLMKDRNGRV